LEDTSRLRKKYHDNEIKSDADGGSVKGYFSDYPSTILKEKTIVVDC
jgi:hypothetical protein